MQGHTARGTDCKCQHAHMCGRNKRHVQLHSSTSYFCSLNRIAFGCSCFKLIAPWQKFHLYKSDKYRVCAAECVSVFGLVDGTKAGPLKHGKDLTPSRVPRSRRPVVLHQNERLRSETNVLVLTTSVNEKSRHNHSELNRDAKSVFPCFVDRGTIRTR